MSTFHLPSFSNQKLKLTFGKLALSAILFSYGPGIFAQNVGINTQQPDPSSALDIVGTDKGLLIPRVSLQSLTDNATIPNPATALLVYNTNAGLGKVGFYYNSGTAASPVWSLVGGGASLALPFSQLGTNNGPLFLINNNDGNGTSVGISGIAANAIGVRGATLSGKGVVGHSASEGTGVLASAADETGKALEVSGPMKIAGPGQSPGNGKVLMSDAVGNATWENVSRDVAFRASGILGNGNQNVLPNDNIKIPFANENYDLGNNYNDISGSPHSTFIVPINGIYQFDVSVGWTCSDCSFATGLQLGLIRNGQTSFIDFDNDSGEGQGHCSISTTIQLEQNDQIFAQITSDSYYTSETLVMTVGCFTGRFLFKQ
ncbi:hypothetical protein LZG74_03900 [Dyadobacter sp. CY327]|uniref:C1q-like domain-containing protein n=1 Tax=Dyadobacter sp. CY327 TaxID=2907301 RepID=UPI001F391465|nr:hypothetical protein [Dyadobacter sp. CY327]MCE7069429.1 hypothetical protein [Dyadobacter sp. CY327]